MKVYFLSSMPCALTLGGAYFGVCDGFERFAEISLKDNLFVEFTPENALPVRFFLNENVRFSPPVGCDVYLLKDGIALYAHGFAPCDFTLRLIAQAREQDTLASVFAQGGLQLSVENGNTLFTATLPPCFSDCELAFHHNLVFLKSPTHLGVYTKNAQALFCERVLSHKIDGDVLSVELPLSDALGRVAACEYRVENGSLYRERFSLLQTRTHLGETESEKIREELLPFAFFETVLLGGDFATMLSPDLVESAESIRSFLGEYVAVAPTASPLTCALVYKKRAGVYEVKEYAVTLTSGKISDVYCD